MAMATRRFRVISDLFSNCCLNALVFSGLAVASVFALPGAHGATGSTSEAANPQPIPIRIRNAFFSAEVSTEYDHELANGNHIHRETRGRVPRDSQGRVRTETQVTSPFRGVDSSENIAIQDPVQRVVIHLDPHLKFARVFHLSENAIPASSGNALPIAEPAAS